MSDAGVRHLLPRSTAGLDGRSATAWRSPAKGAYVGDLSRLFLGGMAVDSLSGTIPESVFMTFQMTFAIITPALITGAFADRMKFSALLWFMGLWGLARLRADRALGVGRRRLDPRAGRARLRRRHGRPHQLRHRRPGRALRARQAPRLRQREHGAAQPDAERDRRVAAVGRLVRLQRRLRARRQRPRRHGDGGDPDRDRRRRARLDVRRVAARTASRACSASSPGRSPGSSRSRRPPASSARAARSIIGIVAGVRLLLDRDQPQALARLRRRARRLRHPRRRRHRRRAADRRVRGRGDRRHARARSKAISARS